MPVNTEEELLNLQTERIENHQARLTIEIEPERLDNAKRQAARKISRQVNIRGFRKGKAPYNRVAQIVGEGAILEEAIDALSNALYKEALDEADVEPSGLGAFEDFKLEPAPTFIYTLPLQPEVDLGAFRDIRLDFAPITINEADIDSELRQMQMQRVEVLADDIEVAELGHRLRIDVESVFIDDEGPEDDDAEAVFEEAMNPDNPEDNEFMNPKKGDTFVSEEDSPIILDPNEDPFVDGFVENLIGAELGSNVEFELTIPDDEIDETIRGRRVRFTVAIKHIESLDIPELDDDFAREASRASGEEEVGMAGLREQVRARQKRTMDDRAEAEFAQQVISEVVKGSDIRYPDVLLEEQIGQAVANFEIQLKQQRLNLEDYLRFTGSKMEDFREQFREGAETELRQSLVMRKLVDELAVEATDEDIDARRDAFAAGFGIDPTNSDFDTPQLRRHYRNEATMSFVLAKLAAMARGEDMDAAVQVKRDQTAEDLQRAHARRERLVTMRAAEAEEAAADEGGDADAEFEVAEEE